MKFQLIPKEEGERTLYETTEAVELILTPHEMMVLEQCLCYADDHVADMADCDGDLSNGAIMFTAQDVSRLWNRTYAVTRKLRAKP